MDGRFFGLDLHKKYATICAVSQQGDVMLREDRLPLDQLATWAARILTSDDAVALEATANSWWAYDCLTAHAGRVVVVNPAKTRLIAEARINTDELSAEVLARLLQSNFICQVWVPDGRTWRCRQLISHRIRLVQERTRLKNRIHAILHRQQIRSPYQNLFSQAGRDWLQRIELAEVEKLLLRQNLQLLKATEETVAEVELTAIPEPGYEFLAWSGDASGSDNPITIILDSDKSVTASFGNDAGPNTTAVTLSSFSAHTVGGSPISSIVVPAVVLAALMLLSTALAWDRIR